MHYQQRTCHIPKSATCTYLTFEKATPVPNGIGNVPFSSSTEHPKNLGISNLRTMEFGTAARSLFYPLRLTPKIELT
jgi:hypothetical protein